MSVIKRFLLLFLIFVCSLAHAQIVLSGGITVSGGVHLSGAACQISTFVLPPGTVGVPYPATPITTSFCTQPVHFSIISGSLPSWTTLDMTTGILTGTPDAAGSSSFTVQVTDAAGNQAVFPEFLSVTIAPATGTPQLPDPLLLSWDTSMLGSPQSTPTKICVGTLNNPALVTCNTSYTAAQYQTALNNAACGQTILLGSMTTFSYGDSFDIPYNVVCPANNWLIISRDTTDLVFPGEGFRVDPCFIGIPQANLPYIPYPWWDTCLAPARHMPQIITSSNAQNPGFAFRTPIPAIGPSISHVRFVGLEITRGGASNSVNFDLDFSLVSLGFQPATDCAIDANKNPVNAVACMNDQPDHIIFDRVLVHGDPTRQTAHGFDLAGCRWCDIHDSTVYDVQTSVGGGSGDSQAITWGAGTGYTNKGWGKFTNDFLSAATESTCLFCGAYTSPVSPATGFDGIPHEVLFDHVWGHKNAFLDVQLGTTFNQSETYNGFTFAAQPGPSLSVSPNTMQLQQGHSIQIDSTWLHDSSGGLNRLGASITTVSVDGFACPTFNTTQLAVAVANGATSITVKSSTGWAVGNSILIVGAGGGGNNYIGSVTAISGTTFTISPATGGVAGIGAQVNDPICMPNGDSTHGLILRNTEHNVGSGGWVSANQVTYQYIACSGSGVPFSDCGAATTAGTHGVLFQVNTLDQALARLGNNLVLSSTSSITVTTSTATSQISVSPKDASLQIQPSYTDANLNHRTFCYTIFWNANYTPASVVWSISPGGANDGTVTTPTGVASNEAVYCSGSNTGVHTITATGTGGVTDSLAINVTPLAPMVAYDLKVFNSKNLFEIKCVSNILVQHSLFTHAWGSNANGGFQLGEDVLYQAINQANQAVDGAGHPTNYGPEHVDNVTMQFDHFSDAGEGFTVAALNQALGVHNILFSNILADGIDYRKYGHGWSKIYPVTTVQGAGGATIPQWSSATNPILHDVFYQNMTIVGAGTAPFNITNNALQFKMNNAVWQNLFITSADPAGSSNKTFINANGENGDCTPNGGGSNNDLEINYLPPCFTTYTYDHIALLDSTASSSNFLKPTLVWPASTSSIGFVNPAAGDYRLCTDVGVPDLACTGPSIYAAGGARQGSNGKAIGDDVAAQAVFDNQVMSGVAAPLIITTNSLANCHIGVSCIQTLTATGGMTPYTWTAVANPSLAVNAIDVVSNYMVMQLPDRNSFHLNGTAVKYQHVDAGYVEWEKGANGHPWDLEGVDANRIYQVSTEGDSSDDATCIANGFPSCFQDPNANKTYINPPALWPRYFVPGTDVVTYTPGPNKYIQTANCGADHQTPIDNLGVRGELTGPFTDVLWQTTFGGNIPDHTPYLLAQKWTKCTANNALSCTTEEDYWLVQRWGQVEWCPKTLSGGTFVTGTCSVNTTKMAGGPGTLNYGCGVPKLPFSGMLPAGTTLTSAPSFNLVDSTGDLTGIATTLGSNTFTVQVTDAAGNIVSKTLSLTVVP